MAVSKRREQERYTLYVQPCHERKQPCHGRRCRWSIDSIVCLESSHQVVRQDQRFSIRVVNKRQPFKLAGLALDVRMRRRVTRYRATAALAFRRIPTPPCGAAVVAVGAIGTGNAFGSCTARAARRQAEWTAVIRGCAEAWIRVVDWCTYECIRVPQHQQSRLGTP